MSEGTFTFNQRHQYPQKWWQRLLRRPKRYWDQSTEPLPFGASASAVEDALQPVYGDVAVAERNGVYTLTWVGEHAATKLKQ